MKKDLAIKNIDNAIEGLKNSHQIWDTFYQIIDFDSFPLLDEIEGYLLEMAWDTIIKIRNIPEFNGEYDFFKDIMHDIANNGIFIFTDENNKKIEIKCGVEIWDYFKGDNIEEFFDDDVKAMKNNF